MTPYQVTIDSQYLKLPQSDCASDSSVGSTCCLGARAASYDPHPRNTTSRKPNGGGLGRVGTGGLAVKVAMRIKVAMRTIRTRAEWIRADWDIRFTKILFSRAGFNRSRPERPSLDGSPRREQSTFPVNKPPVFPAVVLPCACETSCENPVEMVFSVAPTMHHLPQTLFIAVLVLALAPLATSFDPPHYPIGTCQCGFSSRIWQCGPMSNNCTENTLPMCAGGSCGGCTCWPIPPPPPPRSPPPPTPNVGKCRCQASSKVPYCLMPVINCTAGHRPVCYDECSSCGCSPVH